MGVSLPSDATPMPLGLPRHALTYSYGYHMYSTQLWSAIFFSSSLSMLYSWAVSRNAVRPGLTFMLRPEPSAHSTSCSRSSLGSFSERNDVKVGGSYW